MLVSNKNIFWYAIIIIVCLLLAKYVNIKLSTIFFLIIGIILIIFIQQQYQNNFQKEISNHYPDLIKIICSINKYKNDNPTMYQNFITNFHQFIQQYKNLESSNCQETTQLTQSNQLTRLTDCSKKAINYLDQLVLDDVNLKTNFNATIEKYITNLLQKCNLSNQEKLPPKPFNFDDNLQPYS